MERKYTIETTTSSTKPTTYLFRVWGKDIVSGDSKIETSLYDMTREDVVQLYDLFSTVLYGQLTDKK